MSSNDRQNLFGISQDNGEIKPSDLALTLGFILNKVAQKVKEDVDKTMEQFGIESKHCGILILLANNAPMQQAEIGKHLWIDRTTMVTLIDTLEAQNLVLRERDPKDRRAYAISISEKGHEILPKIRGVLSSTEQNFLSALNDDERTHLMGYLLRLLQA